MTDRPEHWNCRCNPPDDGGGPDYRREVAERENVSLAIRVRFIAGIPWEILEAHGGPVSPLALARWPVAAERSDDD